MRISNFEQANEYLQSFYPNSRTEYSLDNMKLLMKHLGNPQDKYRIVHVAGTSGKTSTTYYVSALLTRAGVKTGMTISPHVDQINERLQINGQPLDEKKFCRAMTKFAKLLEDSPAKTSWFETMMAFAYWYFAEVEVDYAVIEVGLGGLKDATNVISRRDKTCIITDIGMDHTAILGSSLTEIAKQKVGIVHAGNTVFTHSQSAEIISIYYHYCNKQRAVLKIVDEPQKSESKVADYQQRNFNLAHQAYRYLARRDGLNLFTNDQLGEIIKFPIPGRMDVRRVGSKTLVMDGAHNYQKMSSFIDSFNKLYPKTRPVMLVAFKDGREYQELLPMLKELTDHIITTEFSARQDIPQTAISAQQIAGAFQEIGIPRVECYPKLREAYEALIKSQEQIAIITGSFYLISQLRNLLADEFEGDRAKSDN